MYLLIVNVQLEGEEAIKVKELAILKLGETQARFQMADGNII